MIVEYIMEILQAYRETILEIKRFPDLREPSIKMLQKVTGLVMPYTRIEFVPTKDQEEITQRSLDILNHSGQNVMAKFSEKSLFIR